MEKVPLGTRGFLVMATGFVDLSTQVEVSVDMEAVEFRLVSDS